MQFEVGSIVEGKVTGVTAFGAFVQIDKGVTGLVHISEIDTSYVRDINDFVKQGDTVKAVVISVDDKGKISLSIKKALEKEQKTKPQPTTKKPDDVSFKRSSGDNMSFDDMLSRFKQASDERMQDIKRNVESKRGGSRRSFHNFD